MKEIEPPLWNRENEQLKPNVDVFYPQVTQLNEQLATARRYNVLVTHDDGNLYSPIAEYDPTRSYTYPPKGTATRAEAHMKKGTDTLFLAISSYDVESKQRTSHYYNVQQNGTVLDLDMDLAAIDETDEQFSGVKMALERISSHTQNLVAQKKEVILERRKFARNIVLGGAALALVGSLGVFGARKIIFEPAEAAEDYRVQYDQEAHELPGEGISIKHHTFGRIDPADFRNIPTYGGNDHDFDEPRIIDLSSSDGCETVSTKVAGDQELYAALPSNSKYLGYHFTASSTEDGFNICLTEPIARGDLDSNIAVAVQIR